MEKEKIKINKKMVSLGVFLLILISVIFFYVTLSKKGISILLHTNPRYLLVLFILWALYIFFDSLKFSFLSKAGKNSIGIKTAFETIVIGIFLAAITPFQMSGLPVQIYYLYRKGVKVGEATSYILLRGMVTFSGILVFAIPYSYIFRNTFEGVMKGIYLYAVFVVSFIFLVYITVIFAPQVSKRFLKKSTYDEFMLMRKVLVSALRQRGSRIHILCAFVFTLISLTFLGTIPYAVQVAIGVKSFTLFESVGYQMIVVSSLLFTPTPGGSGIAETAGSYVFLGNVSSVYVFPFIVLWRFFTFYLSAAVGGIVFLKVGKEILK